MDAIILVGGKGTRLREVISSCPKPLAPIRGRPFLDLLLDRLLAHPLIDKIVLAAGYMASQIVERYGQKERIVISHEEMPLGTGGAIKQALPLTQSNPILIMNGDSYFEIDIEAFFLFHSRHKADMSLCTKSVAEGSRYGLVEVNQENRILSFSEKKSNRSGLMNGGIYLMQRHLFDSFPSGQFLSLEEDLFPQLLNKALFSYHVSGFFIDIGTKESYLRAQDELLL